MSPSPARRQALACVLIAAAAITPVVIAAANPLLASRDAFWIVGGMAGIMALALLLVQPLLAAGALPGVLLLRRRQWHRWVGTLFAVLVTVHVGALYMSSPSDIADALLLVAPTPFSIYGVIGLVSVLGTLLLVALRARSGLRYVSWRLVHNALALVIVVSSIAHALLIEGAMGSLSKMVLCGLVLAVTLGVLARVHLGKRFKTMAQDKGHRV